MTVYPPMEAFDAATYPRVGNQTVSVHHAVASVKDAVCPANTPDGGHKVLHAAIARRGYWMQSHILHIPDRVGFFTSGPAPLLDFQGALTTSIFILYCASQVPMAIKGLPSNDCNGLKGRAPTRRVEGKARFDWHRLLKFRLCGGAVSLPQTLSTDSHNRG